MHLAIVHKSAHLNPPKYRVKISVILLRPISNLAFLCSPKNVYVDFCACDYTSTDITQVHTSVFVFLCYFLLLLAMGHWQKPCPWGNSVFFITFLVTYNFTQHYWSCKSRSWCHMRQNVQHSEKRVLFFTVQL